MSERVLVDTLTGDGSYTRSIRLKRGYFNVSIYGNWSAVVTLQRKLHGEKDWKDVDEFTTNVESVEYEAEDDTEYRFIIKSGNYTSGIVRCRISQ